MSYKIAFALSLILGCLNSFSHRVSVDASREIHLPFASGSSCGIYAGLIEIGDQLIIDAIGGQVLWIRQQGDYWAWQVEFSNGESYRQGDIRRSQITGSDEIFDYEIPSNGEVRLKISGNRSGNESGSIWIVICASDVEG